MSPKSTCGWLALRILREQGTHRREPVEYLAAIIILAIVVWIVGHLPKSDRNPATRGRFGRPDTNPSPLPPPPTPVQARRVRREPQPEDIVVS